jgi:hypothetical protein
MMLPPRGPLLPVPKTPKPITPITPARPKPGLASPPSYKKGGKVKKTGMALVHKGEVVKPAKKKK